MLANFQKNILIVDKHEVVILGINTILKKNFPEYTILNAQSIKTAEKLLHSYKIDIVITDISFKNKDNYNGLALCKTINRFYSETKIICFTNYYNKSHINKILKLKLNAIVAKYDGTKYLIKTIRNIDKNSIYYSPAILNKLHDIFTAADTTQKKIKLSKRQKQIVDLIAKAKTNKQIATQLNLSPKTIEAHIHRLANTLGLPKSNRLSILYKLGYII